MMEYKRNKILENHLTLTERNNESKDSYNVYQCYLRSKSIMDREEREATLKLLIDLKKNNPLDEEQRQKLIESVKTLNTELKLGAKLDVPQKRSTNINFYEAQGEYSPSRKSGNYNNTSPKINKRTLF